MDQRLLTDAFLRNYSTLVSSLTSPEVHEIASRLYSEHWLIAHEFESVALEEITASQACYRLVDFIMRKATNKLYLTFLEILANNLHRLDLLELFDIPPCRVANERSNDDEQKICTRNSLWKSLRQSCILYDSHSSSRSDYRLPLISFEFEEKMKKEKKMERVHFDEIPISSDVLSESHAIQKLTISRQELVRVVVQLQNFKNITALRIIHCQWTQIPQEVFCLTKLEELDLHGNCFENANIADFSDYLPHLKVLDVRYCRLKEISDWIGSLLQLEKLLISGNKLEGGLGRSLERLKMLRYLDMANCKLKDLPDWLAELSMLQELYLSNNNFNAGINSAIGQLHQLKKLDLSLCNISMLPTSLGDLEQLEELNLLSNNFLTGLSEAIGRLRQFKALYIGHCGLLTIPDWIHKLDKLQEINLSRNNFSNGINSAIGQLLRLKKLDLSQCRLSTLPDSFGHLEQLEELDLSGNHFTTGLNEAIGQLRHLKVLYISQCGLLTVPDWIKNLDQLLEIDLSMNDFSDGINQAIGQLHRLRKLDLSRCSLSALPTSFGNLEQLIDLSLEKNKMDVYPQCTLRLENLQRLDVSREYQYGEKKILGITILPVELADSRLSELILYGHPITEPPKEIWEQGLDAIKSYFKEQLYGLTEVLPDTINMIGEVRAGKTSIAQSLQKLSPQPAEDEKRTLVMDQLPVTFGRNREWLININDFGGHAIYHSVISIFLPMDGLVILAYDMSKDFKEQIRYVRRWLLTVIAKCKEIRVIVVGTHADKVNEMRQDLTKDMESFTLGVFKDVKSEVVHHIDNLKKEMNPNAEPEWIGMIEKKRQQLEELRKRLDEALVGVVSLSCCNQDEALQKLHQLVSDKLRAPIKMPRRWSAVMEDITKATFDCHYIKWKQVQDIYKKHVTNVEGDGDLLVILRYLASTSKIIWLEKHDTLGNIVFNSPQKVIEVCKSVLHHDRARLDYKSDQQWTDSLANKYPNDVKRYAQGIVHQPFMKVLLQSTDDEQVDISVNFLKIFNLISEIKPDRQDRIFVIPSNLPKEQPTEKMANLDEQLLASEERIVVEWSFVGAVIPMSFFETSVSSMLTAAHELTKNGLSTESWHDGLYILYKEVFFTARRENNTVIFTAFSDKRSDEGPWTILRPIFERLYRYITGTWHGALPECHIVCLMCQRKKWQITTSSTEKVGKFEVSFEVVASASLSERYRPTCTECLKTIPRLLCLPMTTGRKRPRETTNRETSQETSGSAKKAGVSGRGDNQATAMRSGNSQWKDTDTRRLESIFRNKYDKLTYTLTLPESKKIASVLYAQKKLIQAEWEEVSAITTATTAAQKLVDYIMKKNEKQTYCTFLEVLESSGGRNDLLSDLFSTLE